MSDAGRNPIIPKTGDTLALAGGTDPFVMIIADG